MENFEEQRKKKLQEIASEVTQFLVSKGLSRWEKYAVIMILASQLMLDIGSIP